MLFKYEHYYFFKAPIISIKAELPDEILPYKHLSAAQCPKTPPAPHKQPKADAREELSSAEGHDVRASPHNMQGAMLPNSYRTKYPEKYPHTRRPLEKCLKVLPL